MDHCATVCSQVPKCSWWTWGVEEFAAKCWLRTGTSRKSKRYGFSSGTRNCTVALKTATTTPAADGASEVEALKARRLSSFDDLPQGWDLPLGSMLHMPIFEWRDKESELRREMKGESCRIHGYFDVNRVPGNFHIGVHGAMVPSYLSFYDEPAPPQQNMRHTINSLAFIDVPYKSGGMSRPLDGFENSGPPPGVPNFPAWAMYWLLIPGVLYFFRDRIASTLASLPARKTVVQGHLLTFILGSLYILPVELVGLSAFKRPLYMASLWCNLLTLLYTIKVNYGAPPLPQMTGFSMSNWKQMGQAALQTLAPWVQKAMSGVDFQWLFFVLIWIAAYPSVWAILLIGRRSLWTWHCGKSSVELTKEASWFEKDMLVEMGPEWLTQAFHKSGVLPRDNAVTKITDAKEFVGGGAGLKCTFTVEYKKDEAYLHKKLFAKLPHKPGGSDRYFVSCMWNHDRPEIVFNIFLQDSVPFRVPKFYFGDISATTTNFILITETIDWAEGGKKEYSNEIMCYCCGAGASNPHDYVGLTHNNLQIDNAFFWRNEQNEVEVGLLDWGVLACGPLIGAMQGCISGASTEVLLEPPGRSAWKRHQFF
eukprot:g16105.t1